MPSVKGLLSISGTLEGPSRNLSLLGPLMAAALSEAIRKDTGLIAWLHWPDLTTVDGSAVGRASLSRASGVTNVELRVNCFAPGAKAIFSRGVPSGSILDALGVEIDPSLLRERVLDATDWLTAEWEKGAYGRLVERIQPSIAWMGQPVKVVKKNGDTMTGSATGVDEKGSLLLHGKLGPVAISPEDVEFVLPVRQSTQTKSARRTLL